MDADKRWKALKKFIEDDLKNCKSEAVKQGDETGIEGWHMCIITIDLILREMARIDQLNKK